MENIVSVSLEAALAQVIQQLANFFGTTTNAVMEKMPEFLAAYAWYATLNGMHYIIWIPLLGAVTGLFIYVMFDFYEVGAFKKCMKTALLISIGIVLFLIIKDVVLCFVCPEIVGGIALLEKIGYLTK